MGFRVLQLQFETLKKDAIITEGVVFKRPNYVADLGFAKLNSRYKPQKDDLSVTLIYDYEVKYAVDGFKEFDIRLPVSGKMAEDEEGILLVIYHADLVKGGTKIAGRYPGDGIWLLRPNDSVLVTRGDDSEKFKAVKKQHKMNLIKI